jgi:hypothetical protein
MDHLSAKTSSFEAIAEFVRRRRCLAFSTANGSFALLALVAPREARREKSVSTIANTTSVVRLQRVFIDSSLLNSRVISR